MRWHGHCYNFYNSMVTVSLQPFHARKIFLLVAALVFLISAACFADPVYMQSRYSSGRISARVSAESQPIRGRESVAIQQSAPNREQTSAEAGGDWNARLAEYPDSAAVATLEVQGCTGLAMRVRDSHQSLSSAVAFDMAIVERQTEISLLDEARW